MIKEPLNYIICDICKQRDVKNIYKCPNCQINYCSLKCYQKPIHNDCENIFRRKEINKIINIDNNNENYDQLIKKIKEKTYENESENKNKLWDYKENDNEIEDFGPIKHIYDNLSKEKKVKFKEYIKECQNTEYGMNDWTILISQPWWLIIYDLQ